MLSASASLLSRQLSHKLTRSQTHTHNSENFAENRKKTGLFGVRLISIFEAVAAGSLVSVLLSCRAAESARPESASAAVRARRVHVADAHREEALEAQRRQKLFSMCTVQ